LRLVDPTGQSTENPGTICVDRNCQKPIRYKKEGGVEFGYIKPGECQKADGAWGVDETCRTVEIDFICHFNCKPCKNNEFKIGDGCTVWIRCKKGKVYVDYDSRKCKTLFDGILDEVGGGCGDKFKNKPPEVRK
jgi:hypothetical protein